MIFDPLWMGPIMWMIIIPMILVPIICQMRLQSAYARYSKEPAECGLTGAEVAQQILDSEGLGNVSVEEVDGHLTDHYDPRDRTLHLSSDIYHGTSLAALGVAAHETGHAIQHKLAYAPLQLRMSIIPITNFASGAAPILVLGGFFVPTAFKPLLDLAIILFTFCVFFQLVTLPVEYDASRRAKDKLRAMGLITQREAVAVKSVLSAAALTYVAALVVAVLHLVRLLMIRNSRD